MAAGAIAIQSGNPQAAEIGAVYQPMYAVVRDTLGNLLPNEAVYWSVPQSGASGEMFDGTSWTYAAQITVTNVNGVATAPPIKANQTLGPWSGLAQCGSDLGVLTSFDYNNINIQPPTLSSILIIQGNNQTVELNQSFPTALIFQYMDQHGSVIPSLYVSIRVRAPVPTGFKMDTVQGIVQNTTLWGGYTDGSGRVTITLRAGSGYGTATIDPNDGGTVFALATEYVANPAAPATIEYVSGNNQVAPIGQLFLQPLVVLVKNRQGTPINGIAVTYTAPSTDPKCNFRGNTTYSNSLSGQLISWSAYGLPNTNVDGSNFINMSFPTGNADFDGGGQPTTVMGFFRIDGPGVNDFQAMYSRTSSNVNGGMRMGVVFSTNKMMFGGGSSGVTPATPDLGAPYKTASVLRPINAYAFYAGTWDGQLSAANIKLYQGDGTNAMAELTIGATTVDGAGSILTSRDAGSSRISRAYAVPSQCALVGAMGWIARWGKILTLAEIEAIRTAGPLSHPDKLLFVIANPKNSANTAVDSATAANFTDYGPYATTCISAKWEINQAPTVPRVLGAATAGYCYSVVPFAASGVGAYNVSASYPADPTVLPINFTLTNSQAYTPVEVPNTLQHCEA